MHIDGYGIVAAVAALTLRLTGFETIFTPRGPLGWYRVIDTSCLEDLGIDRDVVTTLLPRLYARRVTRGIRETPRLYQHALEKMVENGVPLVPDKMAYLARNVVHVRIGVCNGLEYLGAIHPRLCGDKLVLEDEGECTAIDACVSRTKSLIAAYGSTISIAPPWDNQVEAVCDAIRGLGPHTAQH